MTTTIVFHSLEMEVEASTSDAEIRAYVEMCSTYEFDREDVTPDQVEEAIEELVRGLCRARDEYAAEAAKTLMAHVGVAEI